MALDRPRVQGEIRVDVPFWLPFHEKLVAKAQSNTAQTCFFGDSITESLQGTQAGKDCSWCLKGKNALKDIYGDEVLVLGISGDQSRHLLWRVSHGEISQSCKKAFVLIGTNDLGYAAAKARENGLNMESSIKEARDSAIQGMEAVARSLHRYNMHIIMVGILPRNPSVFRETIDEINEYFRRYAVKKTWMTFLDCNDRFLTKEGMIDLKLMPDGLHPAGYGARTLVECYKSLSRMK